MCSDVRLLNARKGGKNKIEIQNNYKIYMHTNRKNQKKYIGMTKLDVNVRWNNGQGYTANTKFYEDIKKYGWDNFDHEILFDNLNYVDAKRIEMEAIKKYDSANNGYNNLGSETQEFSYFDFADLNNKQYQYKNSVNYFTRIPNVFIQNNLHKKFGLNRIFLIVYILIDRNRSYEDKSYITIGQVLRLCKYKMSRRKPKVFYEIIKSILFLRENYCINTNFDFYTIGYDECIPIEIITENFDAKDNFTKIYGKNFDWIFDSDTKLSKESILTVYLYIISFIGSRSKKDDGSEYSNVKDNPEAFWRSIESMAKELSMSKDTINQCIDYLTTSSDNRPALLIKREVGSVQPDKTKPPKNVPNIYVLNKEGCEREIKWALNKLKEIYDVDEFYPSKSGNYRFE